MNIHPIQFCVVALYDIIYSVLHGNTENDWIKKRERFKMGQMFLSLSVAEYFARDILHSRQETYLKPPHQSRSGHFDFM